MITYDPFWKSIQKRKISTYSLINDYKISSSTISRLKNNKAITTTTLNDLCKILSCKVEDVIQFVIDK